MFFVLVLFCLGAPVARADLEQVRKEGEVVLYTTMVVSDFQVFQKALAKKYPFLKVHHVRLGVSTLVSRAVAMEPDSKRIAELIEQSPHVIKYEGDAGRHIKQFNEIFLGR